MEPWLPSVVPARASVPKAVRSPPEDMRPPPAPPDRWTLSLSDGSPESLASLFLFAAGPVGLAVAWTCPHCSHPKLEPLQPWTSPVRCSAPQTQCVGVSTGVTVGFRRRQVCGGGRRIHPEAWRQPVGPTVGRLRGLHVIMSSLPGPFMQRQGANLEPEGLEG